MRSPNLLGIGTARSGSTWLHENLKTHPDIWLPPIKELQYFDESYYLENLISLRERIANKNIFNSGWRSNMKKCLRNHLCGKRILNMPWEIRYFLCSRSDDWYRSLFENRDERFLGEIGATHCSLPDEGIMHIKKIYPDPKIIFIIRNPIERAWSHACMYFMKVHNISNVDEIPLEKLLFHVQSQVSKVRSDYVRMLENWSQHFSREQIFVGFFDEIQKDPEGLLKRIYQFLGVPTNQGCVPEIMNKRYHVGLSHMPDNAEMILSHLYLPLIREQANTFGGYTSGWLNRAEESAKAYREKYEELPQFCATSGMVHTMRGPMAQKNKPDALVISEWCKKNSDRWRGQRDSNPRPSA